MLFLNSSFYKMVCFHYSHCSKNLPIQWFIVRFIATLGVTDKIMPYLPRLSFWPIYRYDKRFIGNLPIKLGLFLALCLQKTMFICVFVDLVMQYVLLPYFLSLYDDSKARNQGNTYVQYCFCVEYSVFYCSEPGICKKWPINSRPIKFINRPISD